MNLSNPQEHVPKAKQNNRVIKERVRATYHCLPYKQLTKTMTIILVMDLAKKLNFFPTKNGISKYYSPRMILHQKNLDYTKHCKFAFGTYVQAHDKPSPKNNLSACTLDCIYLRYRDTHQGGHELLHLPTNKIIVRRNITPMPITKAIVDTVEAIANKEGMTSGLKIVSKTDNILYDSDWIAGVDSMDNDNDDATNYDENQDQDYMHPDNIEGLGNAKQQNILPNANNNTTRQRVINNGHCSMRLIRRRSRTMGSRNCSEPKRMRRYFRFFVRCNNHGTATASPAARNAAWTKDMA